MSVQPASPTLLAYDLQDTARNSRRGKPRGGFAPTHFDLYHTAADGDGEDVLEPMEGPPAHVRLPPVQFPTNDSVRFPKHWAPEEAPFSGGRQLMQLVLTRCPHIAQLCTTATFASERSILARLPRSSDVQQRRKRRRRRVWR